MLRAGKYWIGDPCYMFDEDRGYDWSELLEQTDYFNLFNPGDRDKPTGDRAYRDREMQNGEFSLNDHKYYVSTTAYGDGCYLDQYGNEYGVDAGMLSCIPIELIGDLDHEDVDRLGTIHEFTESFRCSYDNGRISFGEIEINTGDEEEEICYYCGEPESCCPDEECQREDECYNCGESEEYCECDF